MKILGIETSCDDTGVAVLETKLTSKLKILSNIVSSQVKLHAQYGGVYPTLAKREHQKNLPIVLKKALKEAGNSKVDIVAVTAGPGLEPCLWVGVNFAKDLTKKLKAQLVPVDHMEGHILVNFIGGNSQFAIRNSQLFPAIALAVSGGHTQLILMKGIGKYKILGETRDDAAGECFDKTARILGLPYPGGPPIAQLAARKFEIRNSKFEINLPRPMMYQKNYDFSFSGLKTAVLYNWRSQPQKIRKSKEYIQAMASEIQQAIIDVLIHKTLKAAKAYKAKTIMLGGGVSANEELRKQLKAQSLKLKVNFLAPPKNLCTDNGAMIAAAGYYKWLRSKEKVWRNIEADANLRLQ